MKFLHSKIKTILSFLLILLLALFVFRNYFFASTLFGGDAPYFYQEGLKELFSWPLIWTEIGHPFGGANSVLWISPLMIVYGALGKFLNLGNDTILRLLFLFPSLILSFLGPYYLSRYLRLGKVVQFFSGFIYVFNTYYILLIDGGQVGIALAYGLFPFVVLLLKKLAVGSSPKNFAKALFVSFGLCVVDPRIFAIAFLVSVIWLLLERRFSFVLLLLLPVLGVLNLYWIYPLFKSPITGGLSSNLSFNFLSLINPLLLFSPHFPNNIFGKINHPPFYFAFIPLLVLGVLFFKKKNKLVLTLIFLFLFFSFLTKGGSAPLGSWYDFLVNKIPLGVSFRDASKFFIPVILLGGILIGMTAEAVQVKYKTGVFSALIYLYLLFLTNPAVLGKLNFLLSSHTADASYETIHQKLREDASEFRTVWFTQRHPLSYETINKPTIDARDLANFRPFAAMNSSEDVFNFLNEPKFVDWLKVLNIKYLFLSGDPRNIEPTQKDTENWDTIKYLVENGGGLEKKDWGTSFESYEVSGVLLKTFTVEKLIAVVGPDLSTTTPAVYFEDGKWDPNVLLNKSQESVDILLNGKNKTDLAMSFLQKYFNSSQNISKSQWATYRSEEYLKYKYELLIRGYKFKDFDYGRGISFSTNKGEAMTFTFSVPMNGKYILAVRQSDEETQNLSWGIEEVELTGQTFEYEVVNDLNLKVLNVVALIPKEDFESAESLAEEMIKHYGLASQKELVDLVPTHQGYWKITTNNFNPLWGSVPVFSMVNGYYNEDQQ